MLRTTISIIILFSVASTAFSQLVSLSPLEYEIRDLNKDLHIYDLDITNPNSDTILFDWTLDYSFTPTVDFRVEVWDLNIAWLTSFVTSCESSLPNKLSPHDTMSIKLLIKAKNIPTEILMQNPEINFKLSPTGDCSTTLINYVFRVFDRSTSTETIKPNIVAIYPNPASDRIFLDIPNADNGQVLIYNSLGQVVINKRALSYEEADGIDISSLPAGLYNLKYVSSGAQSENQYHSQFIKVE